MCLTVFNIMYVEHDEAALRLLENQESSKKMKKAALLGRGSREILTVLEDELGMILDVSNLVIWVNVSPNRDVCAKSLQ